MLYTLVVRQADQSYQISINGEQVKKGKLLEDFEPAFVPPAEIEDPSDSKPADWVDQAKIPDPTATKPEDWDESAPLEIPDEDAEMPAGWLEDESPVIPDPDACVFLACSIFPPLADAVLSVVRSPRNGTTKRTATGFLPPSR